MNNGYIQLHRKLLENPIFYKPALLQLFIYCLLKANHKANEFIFNNEMVKIQRGSFLTGRKILSSELKCKEATLYRRLQILKDFDYISIKTTNKYSVITVINYNKYQTTVSRLKPKNERKSNNKKDLKSIDNIAFTETGLIKSNNKVTTNEQQNNTNNNDNNDNNEITSRVFNEITSNFAILKGKNKPESSDYAEINKLIKVKETDSFKNDNFDKVRKLLLLWQILANHSDKIRAGKYFPYIKTVYQTSSYSDYQKIFNSVIPLKEKKEEEFN